MSLERANEMVKFLKNLNEERMNAGEPAGFNAREMEDYGMNFGITCRETVAAFLGKKRAISWGRYLPEELSEEMIRGASKPKASKGSRKRKVTNLRSTTMDEAISAVQASKGAAPSAWKAERLAMIKEIVLQKEAEEAAEAAVAEFSDKEEKSFDKGDSPEETNFEFEPIAPTREDIEEELTLMGTYL